MIIAKRIPKVEFLGPEWGLENETVIWVYQNVVEPLRTEKGIIDSHTHLSARQILENRPIPNILRAMVMDPDPRWRVEAEEMVRNLCYYNQVEIFGL